MTYLEKLKTLRRKLEVSQDSFWPLIEILDVLIAREEGQI